MRWKDEERDIHLEGSRGVESGGSRFGGFDELAGDNELPGDPIRLICGSDPSLNQTETCSKTRTG